MKPWLIFGAGSGIGRHLVTIALQQKRPDPQFSTGLRT